MRLRAAIALGVGSWLAVSSAQATDRVRLLGQTAPVPGTISDVSRDEVKLNQGPIPKKFQSNQIDYIEFEEDPKDLRNARTALRAGKLQDAAALLKKMESKADSIKRSEVRQDYEYYKALIAARGALGGKGSLKEAFKQLDAFQKGNANSYHYYEATELLGDMMVAGGGFSKAKEYYEKLGEASWPDYKVKSQVLIGRVLESQKQYAEAIKAYEAAEGMAGGTPEADRQILAASLGKATATAGSGQAAKAIKMVEDVIEKADPDNAELYARAYNALGNCYLADGKPKEALLAFLHVDLMYPGFPEQHAEALANLAQLWRKVDKEERGAQAQATLREKYPNSRWAKK